MRLFEIGASSHPYPHGHRPSLVAEAVPCAPPATRDAKGRVATAPALRESWIHTGSGATYEGSLPAISLGRGTPGFYGPELAPTDFGPSFSIGAPPIRYPSTAGSDRLKSLIAEYCSRKHKLPLEPDEVIVCNGGTHAILVALSCINLMSSAHRLRCGFVTPTWLALPSNQVRLLGGAAVEISSKLFGSKWTVDMADLELLARQKSLDTLFLVNPSNPTGSLIESELFPLLFDHGISCILDITYDMMVYASDSPPILPPNRERLFIVGSLSKTFAIPGIRLGFLIPPRAARETCSRIVEATTMGVSALSQDYAAGSLEAWQETNGAWFTPVMTELSKRLELTVQALNRSGFAFARPQAGYYVFAQVPPHWTGRAIEFAQALYGISGVEVVPGVDFGSSYGSFIRLSFANPRTQEELIESLRRISQFVEETSPQKYSELIRLT